MTYHLVGVVGTFPLRMLSVEEWQPPVDHDLWDSLSEVWSSWFGPFDEVALYQPRQTGRIGFAGLLFNGTREAGFVKWRPDWDFRSEASLIEIVSDATSFSTPSLKGVWSSSAWSTMGLSALTPGLHSPRLPRPPIDVAKEVAELLDPLIPFDPKHSHWEPMHGDMGPWNLRHLSRNGYLLFDWELTRRAPPGADLVFHRVASKAMHLDSTLDVSAFEEAAQFWITEIPKRFAQSADDQRLASEMLDELRRLS